ncbi:hypothetical protein AB5N19_07475 [Seiridium cardinale]|uniref:Uncharacterized protein n=1 Tax=Seiridium cardinale TaxID=138064 RepID=A0ABR2XSU3_9PEZI
MPRVREITSETGTYSPSSGQVTTAPQITTPAVVPAQHPNTDEFVMGTDTCGFTSERTITCTNPSDYCMNLGDYRGCCAGSPGGSPDQCSATMYTTCQEGFNDAYKAHVLYCAGAAPRCMTHYYTTDASPGSTYTNVACGTTQVFGQLYPFPPELIPTASAIQTENSTSSTFGAVGDEDTTAKPMSIGAIVGAIVGAIILVILLIVATVLIARRKRLQAHLNASAAAVAASNNVSTKPDALPVMPEAERRRRLRLSTIPEVMSPTSPAAKSGSGMLRGKSTRRSYGPDWPIGSADPLESHPVPPPPPPSKQSTPIPEQRLSETRTIPTLNLPNLPAGRQPTAIPPPLKSPGSNSLKMSPTAPDSARVMSKSPRLSYHPVSPIYAAFNDEVETRIGHLDGAGPSKEFPRGDEADEVSPIDEDGRTIDHRLSLVSAPSLHEDRGGPLDKMVSPIHPENDEENEKGDEDQGMHESGEVSPVTVSPVESRINSLDGRDTPHGV